MKKHLTYDISRHIIDQITESVSEPANTIYFVCLAKSSEYEEANTPNFSDTDKILTNVHRELLFGKKISPNDVKSAVKRIDWTANTIYQKYDDTVEQLQTQNTFVLTSESGEFHVFRCLDNNMNSASTIQPLFTETSANDSIYLTSDNYKWKYLYTISSIEMDKFGSSDFIPIIENSNVTANSISGSIDDYHIDIVGQNLNNYCNGTFSDIAIGGNSQIFELQSTDFDLSTNNDFYNNCSIYISSGTGFGQVKTISDYVISGSSKQVHLDSSFSTQPDFTSTFEISPKISVVGDGQNAVCTISINSSANSIQSVNVIDRGSNYTFATVTISANTGEANNASLVAPSVRPIISPKGGHGFSVKSQLYSNSFIFATEFANTESSTITTNNSFRRIVLLKDPTFNNVTIQLANSTIGYIVGEDVVQSNTSIRGTVSTISGNTISLSNVSGYFNNTDLIVGQTSTANDVANTITIQQGSNTVFDQRHKMYIQQTFDGTDSNGFIVGEVVQQQSTNATAIVSEIIANTGAFYTIYLTEVRGNFAQANSSVSKTFIGADSLAVANINTITLPALDLFSGDILYVENIDSVTRSDTQTEKINLVIGI